MVAKGMTTVNHFHSHPEWSSFNLFDPIKYYYLCPEHVSAGDVEMAMTKTGSKRSTPKKAANEKKESLKERVVLKLPKIGKIKRSEIRKAVLAVRDKNARMQTSVGE
jgi:hypothetical protein